MALLNGRKSLIGILLVALAAALVTVQAVTGHSVLPNAVTTTIGGWGLAFLGTGLAHKVVKLQAAITEFGEAFRHVLAGYGDIREFMEAYRANQRGEVPAVSPDAAQAGAGSPGVADADGQHGGDSA